jgi:hypothetical protein
MAKTNDAARHEKKTDTSLLLSENFDALLLRRSVED